MSAEEDEFRRLLKSAPVRPTSPFAGYAVATAVAIVGGVSVVGAKSKPIFISGFLIVAAAAFIAWRTWRANRRWGR